MTLRESITALRLPPAVRSRLRSSGRLLLSPSVLLFGSALCLCNAALPNLQDALGYAFTLALFLTLAAAWELQILGNPHNPSVWPAHLLLLTVLTLFFARTLSHPVPTALPGAEPVSLGWLGDAVMSVLYSLRDAVPEQITRFFINWRYSLLTFLFFCAMCIRNRLFRIGVFNAIILLPWLFTLPERFSPALTLGGILLFLACSRLLRAAPIPALQAGARNLRPLAAHDPDFVVDALRILEMLKNGAPHPVPEIDAAIPHAEAQVDRMIRLGLLELHVTREGKVLQLARTLVNPSPLIALARIPRLIFLLVIVAVWVALPVDLIPDAIPFIGSLDDITLSVLALKSLRE